MMRRADWHQFQLLTKRSQRLSELDARIKWPENVWMGVSVENQDFTFRIDHLRATQAHVKFLSLEPLLGPLVGLDLTGIGWVIVGGESGTGARPIKENWVVDIRDQCLQADVPFFFKQWGGVNKKRTGRELQGRIWTQMPSPVLVSGSCEECPFSQTSDEQDHIPSHTSCQTRGHLTRIIGENIHILSPKVKEAIA